MKYCSNTGKNLGIEVDNKIYLRHVIKTHFVKPGSSYIDIFENYVLPIYKKGDIIACSEKIISLCQNRIIRKENIKLSFEARFLSKFVNVTPAGEAVGNPYKMQIAIMLCGKWKVLYAAICSGISKMFGKKGIFYEILGNKVKGIDGFCNDAFDEYLEIGILVPANPNAVCNEIKQKLGITCMIIDANDFSQDILGKSLDLFSIDNEQLKKYIKDNPAGQENQQTPLILIREEKEIGHEYSNCR